jgi:hypothetical protein
MDGKKEADAINIVYWAVSAVSNGDVYHIRSRYRDLFHFCHCSIENLVKNDSFFICPALEFDHFQIIFCKFNLWFNREEFELFSLKRVRGCMLASLLKELLETDIVRLINRLFVLHVQLALIWYLSDLSDWIMRIQFSCRNLLHNKIRL